MSGACLFIFFSLLFDFCSGELQAAILLLGDDEDLADEGVVLVVEDARGIESLTLDARLEMQVNACRPACLPFKADWIACLKPLPYLDKIAGMVAIERL